MKTKSHELLEVEVTANAPHIAFDNPVRSVLDYVIADDGIYLVAYRNRNTSVLHLSFEMDTLHELVVSSARLSSRRRPSRRSASTRARRCDLRCLRT